MKVFAIFPKKKVVSAVPVFLTKIELTHHLEDLGLTAAQFDVQEMLVPEKVLIRAARFEKAIRPEGWV